MHFSQENLSAVWNFVDSERHVFSWLLRFSSHPAYEAFQTGFARLMWESLNEEKWEKVKNLDQEYINEQYDDDVEMQSGEDDEDVERVLRDDEEAQVDAELGDDTEVEDDDDKKQGGDAPAMMPVDASDRNQNSQLTVGYKFDRSFVVRGNKIGVFKHTDDDQLEFATTINNIMTPKGKEFNPRKVSTVLSMSLEVLTSL